MAWPAQVSDGGWVADRPMGGLKEHLHRDKSG